ncbi:MAG: hypothetical protein JWQ46_2399, partial [Phenylobacterium sp.]|nr:hypothetical protein [Phenylobacterium sp.]
MFDVITPDYENLIRLDPSDAPAFSA